MKTNYILFHHFSYIERQLLLAGFWYIYSKIRLTLIKWHMCSLYYLLINKTKSENPDIIVITGDMINTEDSSFEVFINLTEQAKFMAHMKYHMKDIVYIDFN